MRRRTLSWKSYYYYDEYDIPRLAITNHNATGTHIIERRDLIPEDQIIEANLYTNENASKLLIDGNDLENVHQNLFNQLSEGSSAFKFTIKHIPWRSGSTTARSTFLDSIPSGSTKSVSTRNVHTCFAHSGIWVRKGFPL